MAAGSETGLCARCGGTLAAGRCSHCEEQRVRFVHRELVLLSVLIAVTVAAYGLTRAAAASNRDMRLADAAVWSQEGDQARRRGDLDAAVTAFRRASTANPGDPHYPLALAAALSGGHHDDEAERVLLGLRERLPEDPEVSLQLARIEARRSETVDARRHYQNALAALWNPSQADARRRVRVELIRFLLEQGERTRALSELLIFAAEASDDPDLQTTAGQLLLQAGDARRALDMFAAVVRERPDARDALAGAGEAAFRLGEYAKAAGYLGRLTSPDSSLAELRAVSELVLNADPLAPRLGAAERRRRLVLTLTQGLHRLDGCPAAGRSATGSPGDPTDPRSAAQRLLADLARERARPSRDSVEEGLELTLRVERQAAAFCEPSTPLDRAILLIGTRHGLENP